MKKQLITGALALVVGGILSSCHNDEGLYGSIVEQKMQAYQELFVQEFGEIDPNQDWGFGISSIAARTRAITRATPPGYPEGYSGAYPDANLWADQGYNVPDPLTPGQKARIQFYFQTVKNPGGVKDYGQIDFFIQQVYDGCTDPITNYDGYPSNQYSIEKYPAASGGNDMIESGKHMDHLVAGSDKKHIFNFNNGTCSTNPKVGNNNVPRDTEVHSDEIMLMVNTKTDYFSYANSDASYVRPDRYRLVAGSVIDAYIEQNKTAFENWKKQNNNFKNEKDEIVDDDWHRGFIGFDFDMIPDENCLVCTAYDKNGQPVYDLVNHADDVDHYVYSNVHYGDATQSTNRYIYNLDGSFTQYDSSNPELVIDGLPIRYVATQTNQYCAIGDKANIGIGGMDNFNDYETFANYNAEGNNDNTLYIKGFEDGHSDWAALNMKFITKLVRDGYLPVKDKGLQRWVKIGGCADGYYSDWIVSFLPANSDSSNPDTQTIPIITDREESSTAGWHQEGYLWECENSGRVFCEDLGVVRASDIDFNDLVFDAYIFKKTPVIRYWKKDSNGNMEYWNDETKGDADYYAEVYLLAAGGTLDLTISGKKDDGTIVGSTSVKPYMNVGKTTILNTIMPNGEAYDNESDIKEDAPEKLVFEGVSSIANIPIVVFYKEEDQMTALELEAFAGAAPHKLCVPIDTQWPIERAEIKLAYPNFTNYVKGQDSQGKKIIWRPNGTTENDGSYYEEVNNLWNNKNTNYLYTNTVSYTVPDTSSKFVSTGDLIEDQSTTTTTGGYNGEPILIRRRN